MPIENYVKPQAEEYGYIDDLSTSRGHAKKSVEGMSNSC